MWICKTQIDQLRNVHCQKWHTSTVSSRFVGTSGCKQFRSETNPFRNDSATASQKMCPKQKQLCRTTWSPGRDLDALWVPFGCPWALMFKVNRKARPSDCLRPPCRFVKNKPSPIEKVTSDSGIKNFGKYQQPTFGSISGVVVTDPLEYHLWDWVG